MTKEIVARCKCGKEYSTGEFVALSGLQSGTILEWRTCHCGLQLARRPKLTLDDVMKDYDEALKDYNKSLEDE